MNPFVLLQHVDTSGLPENQNTDFQRKKPDTWNLWTWMEATAQLLLFVCFFGDLNLGEDMTSWNHTSICKFGILHHWPGILVDLICTCKTIHQHETWIWSKEENTRENTPNQSEGLFLDFKWNGTYSFHWWFVTANIHHSSTPTPMLAFVRTLRWVCAGTISGFDWRKTPKQVTPKSTLMIWEVGEKLMRIGSSKLRDLKC